MNVIQLNYDAKKISLSRNYVASYCQMIGEKYQNIIKIYVYSYNI